MRSFIALVSVVVAGCGVSNPGSGSAQAFVVAEDTIPDGVPAGSDLEEIHDGWSVSYDKFLAVVGNFRASRQGTSDSRQAADVFIMDMTNLPTSGVVIGELEDLRAARWDKVGYDMPRANAESSCSDGTAEADCDFMRENGFSIYFEAVMTKPDGQSCLRSAAGAAPDCLEQPVVRFSFGLASGTSFDDCSDEEEVPGFAVPSGGNVQVKPTIHGDHWFFNNISQGAEVTARQAQWIADADRSNLGHTSDGVVTADELRASTAGAFFPASLGYNLSGTLVPVVNAFTFLEAQAHTLGDYQGEGECPTREILE